jgi:hypothetical protein
MATAPQYAATPIIGSASLTTADTSLTAPTTVGTVITAGSNGTRIDTIEIIGTATTTACLVNLFIYTGSSYLLWYQVPVVAVTTSTTAVSFSYTVSSNSHANIMPLVLPSGYSLRATVTVTQTGILALAYGGSF